MGKQHWRYPEEILSVLKRVVPTHQSVFSVGNTAVAANREKRGWSSQARASHSLRLHGSTNYCFSRIAVNAGRTSSTISYKDTASRLQTSSTNEAVTPNVAVSPDRRIAGEKATTGTVPQ